MPTVCVVCVYRMYVVLSLCVDSMWCSVCFDGMWYSVCVDIMWFFVFEFSVHAGMIHPFRENVVFC